MRVLSAFISLSLFFQTSAWAVINHVIPRQYVSPRALGMGDAFIAVADDYNTLFYNPAGLARLPEWQLNMFVGAAADADVSRFYQDLDSATKSKDATTKVANLVAENYGSHFHFRAPQLGAIWAKPRWGVGLIPMDLNMDLGIKQQVGPSINVVATQDATLGMGYGRNFKIGKDLLSAGVVLKGIYRIYYAQAVLAPQLAIDKEIFRKENAMEGVTIDGDVGFLYSPELTGSWFNFIRGSKPNFGLVVRNVAAYGFPLETKVVNKGATSPPSLVRVIDVGTAFSLGSFWVFKPRLAIDHRNIMHPNYSWRKGSHVGLELPWKVRSWWQGGWRVGLNQGYWTAGFSGTLGIFTLDVATYGEEVGTHEAPKENRRYMARASLDF